MAHYSIPARAPIEGFKTYQDIPKAALFQGVAAFFCPYRFMAYLDYPAVALANTGKALGKTRERLADGVDPGEEKQRKKRAKVAATANSFHVVAREWLAKQPLKPVTHTKALWIFESQTFPWIGDKPVSAITTPELLAMLRRIEARGKLETAARVQLGWPLGMPLVRKMDPNLREARSNFPACVTGKSLSAHRWMTTLRSARTGARQPRNRSQESLFSGLHPRRTARRSSRHAVRVKV